MQTFDKAIANVAVARALAGCTFSDCLFGFGLAVANFFAQQMHNFHLRSRSRLRHINRAHALEHNIILMD